MLNNSSLKGNLVDLDDTVASSIMPDTDTDGAKRDHDGAGGGGFVSSF